MDLPDMMFYDSEIGDCDAEKRRRHLFLQVAMLARAGAPLLQVRMMRLAAGEKKGILTEPHAEWPKQRRRMLRN